ncbi:MAG: hypothetical protein ACI9EB_000483 [Pseudomonas sp.]|jgi:hypothetical protein
MASGVVTVDTTLGCCGALEPITLIEGAVAKQRVDFSAIDILHAGVQILADFIVTLLHGQQDRSFVL